MLTCWPEGRDDGGSEVPAGSRCRRWRPSDVMKLDELIEHEWYERGVDFA